MAPASPSDGQTDSQSVIRLTAAAGAEIGTALASTYKLIDTIVMSAALPTRSRILGTARGIVQTRGYSRLRYSEVSQAVGIQGPTIHYYFPHKADLGVAVLADYRAELAVKFAAIDRESTTPAEKIARYIGLYRAVLDEDVAHMCPGGMLAAEVVSLPADLQSEVRKFFADNERWLVRVLAELKNDSTVLLREVTDDSAVPAPDLIATARRLLCMLQGALLIARLYDDRDLFTDAVASWKLLVGIPA